MAVQARRLVEPIHQPCRETNSLVGVVEFQRTNSRIRYGCLVKQKGKAYTRHIVAKNIFETLSMVPVNVFPVRQSLD